MSERFMAKSAVMLFLFRQSGTAREILLQKRCNTGYMDGMWDCAASGHVEAGESMKMAVIREAKEELGITADKHQVYFATLTHKYTAASGATYYNGYFTLADYAGIPVIGELDKCAELRWFSVDELPGDFIPDRRQALDNYFNDIPYDETGWSQP